MLTIAVQAGGQSSRMGQDKALIRLGDIPLIEHVLRRVDGLGDEVLITTNRPDEYAFLGKRMVQDRHPGAGALQGLLTALDAAHGDRVLLVGCDMPFINRSLLEHMVNIDTTSDVVIPRYEQRLQPMLAIYSTTCSGPARDALETGEKRMISFFPRIQTFIVEQETVAEFDPEGLSFFNANTPDDLSQAERLLTDTMR